MKLFRILPIVWSRLMVNVLRFLCAPAVLLDWAPGDNEALLFGLAALALWHFKHRYAAQAAGNGRQNTPAPVLAPALVPAAGGWFDVNALVARTAGEFREAARARGVTITTHVARDVPRRLQGGGSPLEQAVNQLVANALLYTSRGGIHIEVESAPTRESDCVSLAISVSDSGIGMSQDQLLALYRSMNESIQADSDCGVGTVVRFTSVIKVATAMPSAARLQEKRDQRGGRGEQNLPSRRTPSFARSPEDSTSGRLYVLAADENRRRVTMRAREGAGPQFSRPW